MFNIKSGVITLMSVIAALLISGCIDRGHPAQSIPGDSGQQPVPIKANTALREEISRLNHEMEVRNLTEADAAAIIALSNDPVESYYAKRFAWLVKNKEYDHLNHPLTFLDWYVRTGEENFCAPHELGHIAAFIEKGDIPLAEETLVVVRQKMQLWDERQEINRRKFPQYYQGLGALKALMSEAMGMLDKKDYGEETVKLLVEIDGKSIC